MTDNVTIGPDGTGNGIRVEKGAKVLLYIEKGKRLSAPAGGTPRFTC